MSPCSKKLEGALTRRAPLSLEPFNINNDPVSTVDSNIEGYLCVRRDY